MFADNELPRLAVGNSLKQYVFVFVHGHLVQGKSAVVPNQVALAHEERLKPFVAKGDLLDRKNVVVQCGAQSGWKDAGQIAE